MATKVSGHMEQNLDMPLQDVLDVMQQRVMSITSYFGVQTLKSPVDFWVYQEILFETKPDFIVEIGNFHGGSALALAHLCDALGNGKVIACDLSHQNVPQIVRSHPRIVLVEGDACASYDRIVNLLDTSANILVIEDSSHTYENTLQVMHTYAPLIKPGQYFIVEDSICHHGLPIGPNPGPYEAIETFLNQNSRFEADRDKESFLITWNPKGYLRLKA